VKAKNRTSDERTLARDLARQYLERGDETGWFEKLYSRASDDAARIPWADLTPNRGLISWLDRETPPVRRFRIHYRQPPGKHDGQAFASPLTLNPLPDEDSS
jgi:hypothetical protein